MGTMINCHYDLKLKLIAMARSTDIEALFIRLLLGKEQYFRTFIEVWLPVIVPMDTFI